METAAPSGVAGPFLVRDSDMTARTFTDSAGLTWQVFEVHRTSGNAGAVSPGLEHGWLAFVAGDDKRRLAPFPSGWATASDTELAALCGQARHAPPPRYPPERLLRPRIRRSTVSADGSTAPRTPESVEETVRAFAREARARGLAAVAAMLELKAMLQDQHPEPDSEAHDRRLVRRWFVDAYYFNRDSQPAPDAPNDGRSAPDAPNDGQSA